MSRPPMQWIVLSGLLLSSVPAQSSLRTKDSASKGELASYLAKQGVPYSQTVSSKDAEPGWLEDGSSLKGAGKQRSLVGVGQITSAQTPRWEDRLLICQLFAVAEVQSLYASNAAELTQQLGESPPPETPPGQLMKTTWGDPAFELKQSRKSFISSTNDEMLVEHGVKITLPENLFQGAVLRLYLSSHSVDGKGAPSDDFVWEPGPTTSDAAHLTQTLEYFARNGFGLRKVHQNGANLFCQVDVPVEKLRSRPSVAAKEKKAGP